MGPPWWKSDVLPIYILVENHRGWYIPILDDDSFTFIPGLPRPPQKRQTLKKIWAWCSLTQNSLWYLCFIYQFMGYHVLYILIHLLPYYHNVSYDKLTCDLSFAVQLPVYQPPIIYQDVEQIYLYKHKWVCSLKVVKVFLSFWGNRPWPFWW